MYIHMKKKKKTGETINPTVDIDIGYSADLGEKKRNTKNCQFIVRMFEGSERRRKYFRKNKELE